jgi:D-alanine-D-alanine ligase
MGQSVDRAVVRGLSLDIIFPIIHGPFGEDGSLQGLLELANVPFVGSGVLASALAMDKSMSKVVFAAHGLPLVPHMVVKASEWETNPETIVDKINQVFSYPVFVKPANLGSSIGVSRVTNKAELEAALSKAYSLDNTLLVEKAVIKAREIECSVLGNESPLTSVPGEVIPSGEFYDYESKYLDDRSELRIPANLSIELSNKVRDLSVKAFLALGCTGMARVDFLLDQDNETLYINEVNTLPGFTTISQYAKLWEATGLAYSALLDRLIELALARHDRKNRIETLR